MAPSAIANAFAGMTQSVDIPSIARDAKAGAYPEAQSFLTPPNSISPGLPPQGFRRNASTPSVLPPSQEVDSEFDLQDAGRRLSEQDITAATLDSAGAITPTLLAKHHLPEILLSNGPLAIRHVMGYLTTTVPGFGGIPPAKARRLVVGALEGRGNGGSGGPYNPEVIFEKVGWGRWDARLRGQPPREQPNLAGNPSPPPSAPSSFSGASSALAIPKHERRYERVSARTKRWARGSGTYSNDDDVDENEDMTMLEHEADKMSLDGVSSSEAEDALEDDDDDDIGDATDDEDWATMGAQALRQGSVSGSHGNRNYPAIKLPLRHRGGPSSSALAKSSPAVHISRLANNQAPGGYSLSSHHFGHATDSQEREAIEALVALRSV